MHQLRLCEMEGEQPKNVSLDLYEAFKTISFFLRTFFCCKIFAAWPKFHYFVTNILFSVELAMIMDRLYGGVCYAGIDTDPELKYPKGAGRVAFSNQQSYIAAISARFVQLQHGDIDKRVEVKPYVLDDQMCDECQGQRCGGKFAPFFCANVTCLQVCTNVNSNIPFLVCTRKVDMY